jgi:hypothetical protein
MDGERLDRNVILTTKIIAFAAVVVHPAAGGVERLDFRRPVMVAA